MQLASLGTQPSQSRAKAQHVYVVGGYGGGSCLKSAEMYNTSAGQWRALPEMSVARQGCAAVCMDGNVYVVGGSSPAATHLASIECYDPIASEWRTLPCCNLSCEHGVLRPDCQRVAHAAEHVQP